MQTMPRPTEHSASRCSVDWFGVPADDLETWWPQVLPFIQSAVAWSNNTWAAEDVRAAILARDMQLWIVFDCGVRGALVTEIVDHPRSRICRCFAFGADCGLKEQWLPLFGIIEDFAHANDCDGIAVDGRSGWARMLQKYGFKQTHVSLFKEIGNAPEWR